MKKFNINEYIYIQITDSGWKHLKKTVGDEYIKHCITPYKKIINGETWYHLQCHDVFSLLPCVMGSATLFETTVMFDDNTLINDFVIKF